MSASCPSPVFAIGMRVFTRRYGVSFVISESDVLNCGYAVVRYVGYTDDGQWIVAHAEELEVTA